MQTGGVKLRPALVMTAFALSCFGLLLFLWLSFGGSVPLKPKGYRVQAQFTEAVSLTTEADVRISGVPVGKVKTIAPDNQTGRSLVEMQIDPKYAPLTKDVRATLRTKTLLGETYVELSPGDKSSGRLPDGGSIRVGNVADSVQLDEIFRAFDPKTREAFKVWMEEQSDALGPNAMELNAALGNVGPFAEDAAELTGILDRQSTAVRRLISNTGIVFDALSANESDLRGLVTSTNTVFRTTARRDREIQESLIALPTFQRELRLTLRRLDSFQANADPLVTQLRPSARELSPTLRDVRAISPDLRSLFTNLPVLIRASRTGFPALSRVLEDAKPLLQQAHPALQQVIPILQFLALDKRAITAFFGNIVAATNATERDPVSGRDVRYLRTTAPIGPDSLAAYPSRIGSNRSNAYMLPGGFDKLAQGLDSYETRQCGRGVPSVNTDVPPALRDLFPESLMTGVTTYVLPTGRSAASLAPPCRQQGNFQFQGRSGQYPVVSPAP